MRERSVTETDAAAAAAKLWVEAASGTCIMPNQVPGTLPDSWFEEALSLDNFKADHSDGKAPVSLLFEMSMMFKEVSSDHSGGNVPVIPQPERSKRLRFGKTRKSGRGSPPCMTAP